MDGNKQGPATVEYTLLREKENTGTVWTRNEEFDRLGYVVARDLYDPEELFCPLPRETGQLNYTGKKYDEFVKIDVESQVAGSLSRYWYPQYRQAHTDIRHKLEEILGRKLYNTYYYDRYYFPNQQLVFHNDRDACEISVSIHISTNLNEENAKWPFCIKTREGDDHSLVLNPGDGLIYMGCERPHWRDPMPCEFDRSLFGRRAVKEGLYYHQIFFHYVLQDGQRAHCAWDRAR